MHQLVSAAAVAALARQFGLPGEAEAAVTAATRQTATAPGSPGSPGEMFLEEMARRVAHVASMISLALNPAVLVVGGDYFPVGGQQLLDRVGRQLAQILPLPCALSLPALSGGRSPIAHGAMRTALADARDELFGPQAY